MALLRAVLGVWVSVAPVMVVWTGREEEEVVGGGSEIKMDAQQILYTRLVGDIIKNMGLV